MIMSNFASVWQLVIYGKYEGWKQKNTMDIDPGGKNTAVRTDDRMRRYYTKIAKRHGHSIAITHVANKMIRIMWYMLKNKKTYNDGKPDLYERKLKRIDG